MWPWPGGLRLRSHSLALLKEFPYAAFFLFTNSPISLPISSKSIGFSDITRLLFIVFLYFTQAERGRPQRVRSPLSTCSIASSHPHPTMTRSPAAMRRRKNCRWSVDRLPRSERFISIHRCRSGAYMSATPDMTPSSLSLAPWLLLRPPPFGMANRSSACVFRHHETNSACSACSELERYRVLVLFTVVLLFDKLRRRVLPEGLAISGV